jgi:transposase-like protein
MSKKRRQFTPAFKLEVVLEGLRNEKPVAQVCREREITDKLYYKWREQFLEQAPSIFGGNGQEARESAEQAGQIADLERMVGRLTLENEILKKAKSLLSAARPKSGRL